MRPLSVGLALLAVLAACQAKTPAASEPPVSTTPIDAAEVHSLHIPPRVPTNGGAPVLVLLHGVGSNERDLPSLAQGFDPRFDVRSLRAPIVAGPNSFAWFHVSFTATGPVHNAPEAEASRQLIVGFLKKLRDDPSVDPESIYLLGFSQGAILGLSVALTEPGVVAGVVAIAGRTLQEIQARTKGQAIVNAPHVLLLHGVRDTKLPFTHATTSDEVLTAAGVAHDFRSYDAGHEVTAEMRDDIATWLAAKLPSRGP